MKENTYQALDIYVKFVTKFVQPRMRCISTDHVIIEIEQFKKSFVDLDDVINSQMVKNLDVWMCNVCQYQSSKKSNVRSHVEAKHVISNGFNCQYCGEFCPNRKALKNHIDRKHKMK